MAMRFKAILRAKSLSRRARNASNDGEDPFGSDNGDRPSSAPVGGETDSVGEPADDASVSSIGTGGAPGVAASTTGQSASAAASPGRSGSPARPSPLASDSRDQSQALPDDVIEYITDNNLTGIEDKLWKVGVRSVHDIPHVTESDLASVDTPTLFKQRFLQSKVLNFENPNDDDEDDAAPMSQTRLRREKALLQTEREKLALEKERLLREKEVIQREWMKIRDAQHEQASARSQASRRPSNASSVDHGLTLNGVGNGNGQLQDDQRSVSTTATGTHKGGAVATVLFEKMKDAVLREDNHYVRSCTEEAREQLTQEVYKRLMNMAVLLAADLGHNRIVRYLLDMGADMYARDPKSKATLLHIAAARGHYSLVQLLIDRHFTCSLVDREGRTPLELAADESIANLFDAGLEDEFVLAERLIRKVAEGNLAEATRLVSRGADPNCVVHTMTPDMLFRYQTDCALHLACRLGMAAIVDMFLKSGATCLAPDGLRHASPLHFASSEGYLDVVKMLVEAGANVDARDKDGRAVVEYARGSEVLSYLEERSQDTDVLTGRLVRSVLANDLERVQLLLSNGADPDRAIGGTVTSKIIVEQNAVSGVTSPLSSGVSVASNASPMSYAAFIRSRKSPNNSRTMHHISSRPPLHLAARMGNIDICAALLEAGADMYVRDQHRMTALHVAAERGKLDVCRFLCDNEMDHSVKDEMKRTPLDLAREKGHSKVGDYLEAVEAQVREHPLG